MRGLFKGGSHLRAGLIYEIKRIIDPSSVKVKPLLLISKTCKFYDKSVKSIGLNKSVRLENEFIR